MDLLKKLKHFNFLYKRILFSIWLITVTIASSNISIAAIITESIDTLPPVYGKSLLSDNGQVIAYPFGYDGESGMFVHDRSKGETVKLPISTFWHTYRAINGDGRYIVYSPNHNQPDLIIYDRIKWSHIRLDLPKKLPGEDLSLMDSVDISANGRFITFIANYKNPTAGAYLYDRDSDANGIFDEPGQTSVELAIPNEKHKYYKLTVSENGRYLAFEIIGEPGSDNTNETVSKVFVRDTQSGKITAISVNSAGHPADENSFLKGMSSDGRFILFLTYANNFSPRSGISHYIRDRDTDEDGIYDEDGFTRVIPVPQAPSHNGNLTGRGPIQVVISGNGRYILYQHCSNYSNVRETLCGIYVYDHITNLWDTVVERDFGEEVGNTIFVHRGISAKGREVIYREKLDFHDPNRADIDASYIRTNTAN